MGLPSPLVGLPIPFGFDGNNVPADLLAFAQRLDDIFSPHTYAEMSALGGSDLWDGRVMYQSDSGALRPFAGLYAYKGATASWQILVPRGSTPWTPTMKLGGAVPTMGTGAEQTGRYSRFGSLIIGQFVIFLGTGFSGASSAMLTIDLPPAAPFVSTSPKTPVGTLSHLDQVLTWTHARLHVGDGSATYMTAYKGGGGITNAPAVQTMANGGWAAGQTMIGTVLYDTPEA
jgi:hypothetical protein